MNADLAANAIARAGIAASGPTENTMQRPRRQFYWRWPTDGQSWFAWAFQNYGSRWIVWRVGPLNYCVEIAGPGQSGGYIRSAP